jgi:hypothetical protein
MNTGLRTTFPVNGVTNEPPFGAMAAAGLLASRAD